MDEDDEDFLDDGDGDKSLERLICRIRCGDEESDVSDVVFAFSIIDVDVDNNDCWYSFWPGDAGLFHVRIQCCLLYGQRKPSCVLSYCQLSRSRTSQGTRKNNLVLFFF